MNVGRRAKGSRLFDYCGGVDTYLLTMNKRPSLQPFKVFGLLGSVAPPIAPLLSGVVPELHDEPKEYNTSL